MYVSIRDDTLLATGFTRIDEGLHYYGISGIELAVDREYQVHAISAADGTAKLDIRHPSQVAELRAQAASAGVRVSGLLLGNNFNADDIHSELAWIVHTVVVAAELDAPAVRIDAIMKGERDLPLEEREAIFARGVHHVLDATEHIPVDLGIENHGFQGNDPAFLEGLISRVGSPRLGLTMDTGNFYWAGHPLAKVYEILERLAPHAKHTHAKNIRYPAEIRETQRELGYEYGQYVCPIAEGDIDHAKVIGYLKAAGYDRDICLEDESLSKYDEAGRRANIMAAADHFRALCA